MNSLAWGTDDDTTEIKLVSNPNQIVLLANGVLPLISYFSVVGIVPPNVVRPSSSVANSIRNPAQLTTRASSIPVPITNALQSMIRFIPAIKSHSVLPSFLLFPPKPKDQNHQRATRSGALPVSEVNGKSPSPMEIIPDFVKTERSFCLVYLCLSRSTLVYLCSPSSRQYLHPFDTSPPHVDTSLPFRHDIPTQPRHNPQASSIPSLSSRCSPRSPTAPGGMYRQTVTGFLPFSLTTPPRAGDLSELRKRSVLTLLAVISTS